MKKIFLMKKFNILNIVFSIFMSLFIVILLNNFDYIFNKDKGIYETHNFAINLVDNNVEITIFNINKYVDVLELPIIINNEENIKFDSFYNNFNNDNYIYIHNENLFARQELSSYIRINKNVKNLKLVFYETDLNKINVDHFKIHNTFEFNLIEFFIILIVLYIILDIVYIIISKKEIKLHLYFLKIALLFGVMYVFLTPMFYSVDEEQHMVRAYNVSYGNIIERPDEKIPWPEKIDNEIRYYLRVYRSTTYQGYIANVNHLINDGRSIRLNNYYHSTAESYLFPAYFFSGIGMLLARILTNSFMIEFFIGRLFNLLLYVFIVTYAIKKAKQFNKIVFAVGLSPVLLYQAASYSADCLTNAMAILAISLTLNYKYKEGTVSLTELLILFGVYVLTFISKIPYFPIVLLILLIPKDKFASSKSSLLIKLFTLFSGILIFGLATIYAKKLGIVQWPVPGVDFSGQVHFILHNPFKFLFALYNTFYNGFINMLLNAICQLGYSAALGDLILVIVIYSYIIAILNSAIAPKINIKDKFVIIIYILMTIGASMSALYLGFTPVGSSSVAGYQGRYLIPVFIPFMLLFVNNKYKIDKKNDYSIIKISIILLFVNIFALAMMIYRFYW